MHNRREDEIRVVFHELTCSAKALLLFGALDSSVLLDRTCWTGGEQGGTGEGTFVGFGLVCLGVTFTSGFIVFQVMGGFLTFSQLAVRVCTFTTLDFFGILKEIRSEGADAGGSSLEVGGLMDSKCPLSCVLGLTVCVTADSLDERWL